MLEGLFSEVMRYLGLQNVSVVVILLAVALNARKGVKIGGRAAGLVEILFYFMLFNALLLASGVQEPRPERAKAILSWVLQNVGAWISGLV